MEVKCPKGDFVAKGDSLEEVKAQLKEHAKSTHNMSDEEFEDTFNQLKSKMPSMPRV